MTTEDGLRRAKTTKKPVIMLLGEFSSGKSTLANILLGQRRSPVRVTATQVPPIWYSEGDEPPVHISDSGEETRLPDGDLDSLGVEGTRAVRVHLQADVLEFCDIVDMPGSSDPNMTAGIWEALLPLADLAIWCTPATQAWRQSEAAIWEDVPEEVQQRSVLLLTRIDKVRSPQERDRVIGRVRHETRGQFAGVLPVSLIRALEALDDEAAWTASGMPAVADALMTGIEASKRTEDRQHAVDIAALRHARAGGLLTAELPSSEPSHHFEPTFVQQPEPQQQSEPSPEPVAPPATEPVQRTRPALRAVTEPLPQDTPEPSPTPAPAGGSGVVPRRVVRTGGGRSARPRRSGTDGSLI